MPKPSTSNKLIGARVREARASAGYTQEVLAAALDTGIMAISRKERGLDAFSAEQLAKVARVLKRDIREFLKDIK